MLGSYNEIVLEHRVFVVDGGKEIIRVLVLMEEGELGYSSHMAIASG